MAPIGFYKLSKIKRTFTLTFLASIEFIDSFLPPDKHVKQRKYRAVGCILFTLLLYGCGESETVLERGPVNYQVWTPVIYDLGANSQNDAFWKVSNDGTSVTQAVNADPSIFLSNQVLRGRIEGRWLVNDGAEDNDWIGFVFGYQDPGHTYIFDWRSGKQFGAKQGMSIKRLQAAYEGPPTTRKLPAGKPFLGITGNDRWSWLGVADGQVVTVLEFDPTPGWERGKEYRFELELLEEGAHIVVRDGSTVLYDKTLADVAIPVGRFGFYNYSQKSVTYKGFTVTPVKPRTIWNSLQLLILLSLLAGFGVAGWMVLVGPTVFAGFALKTFGAWRGLKAATGGQPESPIEEPPPSPQVSVEPFRDMGQQTISADKSDLAGPAIRFRTKWDPGQQVVKVDPDAVPSKERSSHV